MRPDSMAMTVAVFLFSTRCLMAHPAMDRPPFTVEQSMIMPDVPWGPYSDHLGLDFAGHRLFATPQAAHAIAVFDTREWKFLRLIHGVGNPHSVYFSEESQRLFVVDGQSGDVKIFRGADYTLAGQIPIGGGADGSIYDPASKVLYVESGGEDVGMDHALLSAIDPVTSRKVGEIQIKAQALETMTIDHASERMYVNLVEQNEVAVIDLKARRVVATWPLTQGRNNFAMALDPAHGLLYVGCRDGDMRGSIAILKLDSGKQIASLPIGGWVDYMAYDAKRERIYASTGVGHLETYQMLPGERFVRLEPMDTAVMAKTALYSPALDRVFVSVPHLGDTLARVQVFKPLP